MIWNVHNKDLLDELQNFKDCINSVDLQEVTQITWLLILSDCGALLALDDEGRCPHTCCFI